ncbi:Sister chromatid cohesion protein 2 [Malassezia cuniculi]|uniref:Sister chromatid cohesion protein n=1 Tax=Malassezia cuniculi TaxID=948313 RepID=A0AAF0J5D5_9BASI|nr:Sister chromatid cohesion protein 2 [Malassezia cuniculi]
MPHDLAPGTPDTDHGHEPDAFPIQPPSPCSEPSSPSAPLAMLSEADLAALADDVPSRLRVNVLSGQAEALWGGTAASEPPRKVARIENDQFRVPESPHEPFATSDSFAAGLDDWDFDDSQLFSDEVPVLLQESAQPQVALPAGALQRLVTNALEHDEREVARGTLTRLRGDLVIAGDTLNELLTLLRRSTHTPNSKSTLFDMDISQVSRLLALLERSMQGHLVEAEAPPSSQTADADGDRICALTSSLVAAQCVLTILLDEQLPKFLLSEEIVAQCLSTVAASMDKLVLPLVEATNGSETAPGIESIAAALARGASPQLDGQLTTHFEHFSATLLQVEGLFRLSGVSIADALLIRSVYLALSPFFAQGDTPRTRQKGSKSTMLYKHAGVLRPIRLSSLEILRCIFAHYPAQRHWILGEILVSLLRLPDLRHKRRQFRLANGRTVFAISALLLQLVQAAAHTPPALHTQTIAWLDDGSDAAPVVAPFHNVQTLASTIAVYLYQRASEAKLVKSTHDLSYASVVYYLMEDLVVLMFDSAWPAAPLLLSCFCRVMIAALSDPKSSVDAKAIALDHLGIVAAKLKRTELDISSVQNTRKLKTQMPQSLAAVAMARDVNALTSLVDAHCAVLHRLRHSTDTHASAGAADLHTLALAYEIVLCREHCGRESNGPFEMALQRAYHKVTSLEGSFMPPHPCVVSQLVLHSPFVVRYASLVSPLVQAAGVATLATRARALRALGNVCAVDQTILDDASVRRAVAVRLADSVASVREIAVAILSPYLLHHPSLMAEHGPAVSARVSDASPAVRRRALHFLHGMYLIGGVEAKVAAAIRILRCIYDIDVSLQTLARQILQQLWLPGGVKVDAPVEAPQPPLAEVAAVLVGVTSRVAEQPSPLAELLKRISDEDETVIDLRLGSLVDALIGSLFSGGALDEKALLNRVRTVHTLVTVRPTVLTIARAKQLLPYIAGGAAPDETALLEELLKVFRTCLSSLPRTARTFGDSLEKILVPLVSRCTLVPGSTVLQELVACLCAVVHYQTHNTAILQSTVDACVARLDNIVQRAQSGEGIDRAAFLAMCIASLLCEHGRLETCGRGHLVDHVFSTLITMRDVPHPSFHVPSLIAMGYILRAHPSRFIDIADSLDTVLTHGTPSEQGAGLHIILDTLGAEAAAGSSDEVPEDVFGELAGTAEALADSSVSSALMQRFALPALQAALAIDKPQIQSPAMEILSLAVLQGLCHPLQCVPYLVALETAPDISLRARALRLHMHLVSRHAVLLATRFGDGIRKSYEFQRYLGANPLGYTHDPRPSARLADWYALVREKRHTRTEFLRALVRILDGGEPCSEDYVRLAFYAAENLATLEYRIVDEVAVILTELRLVHAGAGQQVAASARRMLGMHERDRELSPLTDEDDSEGGTEGSSSDDQATVVNSKHKATAGAPRRATRQSVRRSARTSVPAPQSSSESELSDIDSEDESDEKLAPKDTNDTPPESELLGLARRALVLQAAYSLERHLKRQYRISDRKLARLDGRQERALAARAPVAPNIPLALPRNDDEATEILETYLDLIDGAPFSGSSDDE